MRAGAVSMPKPIQFDETTYGVCMVCNEGAVDGDPVLAFERRIALDDSSFGGTGFLSSQRSENQEGVRTWWLHVVCFFEALRRAFQPVETLPDTTP